MGSILDVLRFRDTEPQRIVMLGLDAAGKSTIMYSMHLAAPIDVKPTIGFNVEEITVPNTHICFIVWDLGGQETVRNLWKQYLDGVSGLVFVVDSADHERMQEAKEALHAVVRDPNLQGVPVVVVANKQDLQGALSVSAVAERLNTQAITTPRNACVVLPTSAVTGEGVPTLFIRLAELVRVQSKKSQTSISLFRTQTQNPRRRALRERIAAHMPQMFRRNTSYATI
ncbi:unnamed protein product [Schistocephalus solidus]|uniref:ADP-ribosylation factor n=1 Tax=Schistocephalus solidus TaxID=70667 RepID=A0A183TQF7_SCHSO|nr:unnamed protein product [Schistocephalus solidus]